MATDQELVGVAIVGMAGVFPGASDVDQLWDNIVSGRDAITEVSADRWDPVYYDPTHPSMDRFYCRRGGFIDTQAVLDPAALGVMPAAVDHAEPDQIVGVDNAGPNLGGGLRIYTTRGTVRTGPHIRNRVDLKAEIQRLVDSRS